MQMMDVDKLIPHEKNGYFFDDMSGEAWMAFLESIETSGIIEPIVITESSHVIISGHQRVRAAKHFNMKQVPVTFREDKGEDEILKQLIETNIRQRGIGNVNPVKFGRCLRELERIYGIKQGRPSKEKNSNNVGDKKTQEDILSELGINKETYRQYKKLADLPKEIQQMVMDGKVTASSASRIIASMSPEEQEQLAEQIRGKEKVSGQEIKFYKDRVQAQQKEIDALRNQKPQVITKEVEVVPDDYESLKKKAKQASAYQADFNRERQKVADEKRKNLELQEQIDKLKEQTVLEQNNQDMKASAVMFAMQCRNFIEAVGGYVFISEHLTELPDKEREGYIMSAQAVHDWAQVLLNNIERSTNGLLGNSSES